MQDTPRSFPTGDVLGRPTFVTSFVILVRLLPDKTVSRHYTSGRSANKEPRVTVVATVGFELTKIPD